MGLTALLTSRPRQCLDAHHDTYLSIRIVPIDQGTYRENGPLVYRLWQLLEIALLQAPSVDDPSDVCLQEVLSTTTDRHPLFQEWERHHEGRHLLP